MEILELVDTKQDNGTNHKDKLKNDNEPCYTSKSGNTSADKENEPGNLFFRVSIDILFVLNRIILQQRGQKWPK